MSSERKAHVFADQFPMISDNLLSDIIEDMKKNGFRKDEPIVLFEDQILDGRNREKAAITAGVIPVYKKFTGNKQEALDFVISKNLHRRHLNESQRAMIAAKLLEMLTKKEDIAPKSAGDRDITSTTPPAAPPPEKVKKTEAKKTVAKKMNVSPDSVTKAKRVQDKAPEKAKEVSEGKKSLHQADQELKEEKGILTPQKKAFALGDQAVNALNRIPKEFRKEIYAKIKLWIDANIELG